MVDRLITNDRLLREVKEIYDWLDSQIRDKLSGKCELCGQCCDFITFGHRLYVTIPEIMYLKAGLDTDSLKSMPTGRCPYNKEGKCSVYSYRFTGCRIFNCKSDTDVQSELSEIVLGKLKSACMKFQIPYRYLDLASALNEQEKY